MEIFNGRFRFLTYTTLGIAYDIVGGIFFLSIIYNQITYLPGFTTGTGPFYVDEPWKNHEFYIALINPDKRFFYAGVILVILGSALSLIDHQLGIYSPLARKKIKFFKILLIFFVIAPLIAWPILIII